MSGAVDLTGVDGSVEGVVIPENVVIGSFFGVEEIACEMSALAVWVGAPPSIGVPEGGRRCVSTSCEAGDKDPRRWISGLLAVATDSAEP